MNFRPTGTSVKPSERVLLSKYFILLFIKKKTTWLRPLLRMLLFQLLRSCQIVYQSSYLFKFFPIIQIVQAIKNHGVGEDRVHVSKSLTRVEDSEKNWFRFSVHITAFFSDLDKVRFWLRQLLYRMSRYLLFQNFLLCHINRRETESFALPSYSSSSTPADPGLTPAICETGASFSFFSSSSSSFLPSSTPPSPANKGRK